MLAKQLREYLEDPFLSFLYHEVRAADPIRSISLDLTDRCNLRCRGCYFFADGMDAHVSPTDERVFDEFIAREKARGTNFVTVVGGEPALEVARLRKLYQNLPMSVATNGLIRIPFDGLEEMPLGIAVWGDQRTDTLLRGNGKHDVFATALQNYRNDDRAFFYYTVTPGNAGEIESVVTRCVENGNRVLFNFYSDLANLGGPFDHRIGFGAVGEAIDEIIDKFPGYILLSSYVSDVVSRGELYDERWGYDVCTSITVDDATNRFRTRNGHPVNHHFRAYNADFRSWRRCCTGNDRDCSSCFDVWQHFSWIMLNMRKHLGTKQEFTNWVTTMYLFYMINRLVATDGSRELLHEIHRRTRRRHNSHHSVHTHCTRDISAVSSAHGMNVMFSP
jgi:Radical SAM superfamily